MDDQQEQWVTEGLAEVFKPVVIDGAVYVQLNGLESLANVINYVMSTTPLCPHGLLVSGEVLDTLYLITDSLNGKMAAELVPDYLPDDIEG